jgi:CRP-like cAMP-binding protein
LISSQLERRLSDSVFKSVPQRVATTLCLLADEEQRRPLSKGIQVSLTHEQVAALAGTSRETTTMRLNRGRITILDLPRLASEAGD